MLALEFFLQMCDNDVMYKTVLETNSYACPIPFEFQAFLGTMI